MANPFKIILNPRGNAGAVFNVDEGETCYLEVKFDYLFEFDCTELDALGVVTTSLTPEQQDLITSLEQQIATIDSQISALENTVSECEILLDQINSAISESDDPKVTQQSFQTQIDGCNFVIQSTNETITSLTETKTSLEIRLNTMRSLKEVDTSCSGATYALETLDVCWTIEKSIGGTNVETVYEKQLLKIDDLATYLNGNENTGLLFVNNAGGACGAVKEKIKTELGHDNCDVVSASSFNSNWLTETQVITDSNFINAITDNEIKLAIKVKDCCVDFNILVDRIELNQKCTKLEKEDIFVSKTPSFELERICDNKKSWVAEDSREDRLYDLKLRETEYSANHHKLVINSKEVDLNISPATAIETDIQCYINDNSCLLDPLSSATPYTPSCPTLVEIGTTGTTTVFGCPAGYTLDPDGSGCTKEELASAIVNDTTYVATLAPNVLSYNQFGANFYANIDSLPLPLEDTSPAGPVKDASGTAVPILQNVENEVWGSGTTSTGRLNAAGIWGPDGENPIDEWIGFAYCLDIQETKEYQLGIAGDNFVRIRINGVPILTIDQWNTNFWYWNVFPVTLQSGANIIELEGLNNGSQAAFAAEIYSSSTEALSAMTTPAQLSAVTIFSTLGQLGEEFELGEESGLSCPSGFALNACGGNNCVQITKLATVPSATTSGETCLISSGTCTPTCGDISAIDINGLLSTELSSTTTVKEFERVLCEELIDVKSRKTLSAYPTLRSVYDRYMNSTDYCNTQSAGFDYCQMADFTDLVGDYWIDLIEQVMPSTSIWGSTYVYKNTIFDKQKFKYKSYNLQTCDVPASGCGSNVIAFANNVEVIKTELGQPTTESELLDEKQAELDAVILSAQTYNTEIREPLLEEYNQASIINAPNLHELEEEVEAMSAEYLALINQAFITSGELEQLKQTILPCSDEPLSGTVCDGVYILERSYGSEFRGGITVSGPDAELILGNGSTNTNDTGTHTVINEQ